MELTPKDIERISKALGDPNRLKLMTHFRNYTCMPCGQAIEMLNLAQPSVSHHLKQLVEAGLLLPQKDGRNITYTLNKEVIDAYRDFLSVLSK